VIKRRKRRKSVPKKPAVYKPPELPEEWWQRWKANDFERAHEFIRTGRTDECDRIEAELESEAAKSNSRARSESRAERWGIDPEMFDRFCRSFERVAPGQGEARAAYRVANGILNRLMKRALKSESIAIAIVTKVAHDATSDVARLTREQPEKIRELAERAASFPILISPHKDMSGRAYIEEKINLLNIGAHAAINPSGFDMRPSERQPFKNAIHFMCDRLCRVVSEVREDSVPDWWPSQPGWRVKALKLPPLSEHTCRADAESWFVVAWEALCDVTAGRPEDLPLLKGIGDYKKQKAGPQKEFSIRPSKFSNARRAGLYERLKTAWLARYVRVK